MLITRTLTLACIITFCIVPAFSQEFDSNFGVQLKGVGKILSVDQAPNGDVLAVGDFDFHNGEESGRVLRLDADGNFVSGFNKVYTDESVKKIIALPDGKMLIQGLFSKVNGNLAYHLARLNADGSFDASFAAPLSSTIYRFALQSNGKIIVIDYPSGKVYRLNANGSVDNTYASTFQQVITDIFLHVDSKDRVLVGNWKKVVRLTSGGMLDNTFNSSIQVHNGAIFTLTTQSDGKVLLGGDFSLFAGTNRGGIIRLEENGLVDPTFNGLPVGHCQTHTIEVTSDGGILTGGNDAKVYLFSSTGDSKQYVSLLPFGTTYSLKQTKDKNIIVGGWFQYISGQEQSVLAKLKPDFSLNAQFSNKIFQIAVAGRDNMAITPNGEILLGGWDQNFVNAENKKVALVRITKQGAIDETFQPALNDNSMVNALEVQNNNQILVSGFLYFNGTYRGFARLKSDGTLDPSFNSGGSGASNPIEKMRFNGSDIYIAGPFTSYNGTPVNAFAVLSRDGQIKKPCQVFGAGTWITSFDFQSDGKIIVIGNLKMPDGSLKGMARLHRDLTLDDTFTAKNHGFYSCIKIDRENRIYVGGKGGLPIGNGSVLVRLNHNGEVDTDFKNGLYLNSIATPTTASPATKEVSLIDILPSNQIVVGGYFTHYKGVETNGIIIFDKDADSYFIPTEPLGPTTFVKHLLYHGSSVYAGGRLSFDGGKRVLSLCKIKLNYHNFLKPDDPTNANLSNDQVPGLTALEWKDNTDAEDGYEIERYHEVDDTYIPIASTPSNWTSFLDNTNSDNEFRYRIRSYNEKSKSVYKYIGQQMAEFSVPFSPIELTITENEKSVYLSWNDESTNETGFVIERKVNNETDFVEYAEVNTDITEFIDHYVQGGNTYHYRVASFNGLGKSSYIEGSLDIITGTENPFETAFVIYPNPASSYLNIFGQGTIQTMRFINSMGQPIALSFTQPESNVYRIDVSNFPNGLYWLTLTTTEGVKRIKVIKH